MNAYKYRAGGKFLERDLEAIFHNYFYAPNAEILNDPCETIVLTDRIESQLGIFDLIGNVTLKDSLQNFQSVLKNFMSNRKKIGIYSLSKTYSDELLWAYYANNHSGFCIEYDLEKLMEEHTSGIFYSFNVAYASDPPQLETSDFEDTKSLLIKTSGTKSKKWEHEQEIRILTDKHGENYYFFSAVKAIYFGFRMNDDEINIIQERLAGRDLKYYRIKQIENIYSYEKELIHDPFMDSKKYLYKVYIKNNREVDYSIDEVKLQAAFRKATLSIVLDSEIPEESLLELGRELKIKLFRGAEMVYIFYYLKSDVNKENAWGISHFDKDKEMINIFG